MAATGSRSLHLTVPRAYALAWPAYGAGVLALDTHVGIGGECALGVLTWLVLLCALWPLTALARAQALGVVAFATVGEVAGSIVWGVYHYRLHDLPLFVPPGHGLVYLSGLAVARIVGERRIVWAAAVASVGWGLAGVTLLPRLDVAGGLGVGVLGLFLWRSRARAAYAGVFFVVAALELYGTSVGAWHWTRSLPGLGISAGNPPSGAASGYVGFDVMAMLVAPTLVYAAAKLKPKRATRPTTARLRRYRRAGPPHIVSDDDPASYSSTTPNHPTGHPVLPPVDPEINSRATANRRPGRRQRGPLLRPCRHELEGTDRGAAMKTWTTETWLARAPEHVLEPLPEPAAIAGWAPLA